MEAFHRIIGTSEHLRMGACARSRVKRLKKMWGLDPTFFPLPYMHAKNELVHARSNVLIMYILKGAVFPAQP